VTPEQFWNGLARNYRLGSEVHALIQYFFLTIENTVEDDIWTGLQEGKQLSEILLKHLEKK
jgi:hypothetical protein